MRVTTKLTTMKNDFLIHVTWEKCKSRRHGISWWTGWTIQLWTLFTGFFLVFGLKICQVRKLGECVGRICILHVSKRRVCAISCFRMLDNIENITYSFNKFNEALSIYHHAKRIVKVEEISLFRKEEFFKAV